MLFWLSLASGSYCRGLNCVLLALVKLRVAAEQDNMGDHPIALSHAHTSLPQPILMYAVHSLEGMMAIFEHNNCRGQ